jgi:hypothetical protein
MKQIVLRIIFDIRCKLDLHLTHPLRYSTFRVFQKGETFRMKFRYLAFVGLTVAFMFLAGTDTNTFAQGRSGNGGGRPAGVGGGPPAGNPGVDRGINTASSNSMGRSDSGMSTANDRSNGRSMSGMDRARLARENANSMSDNSLNRYRGLSNKLGTTPEQMRAAFQAALLANPNLTYGQFVAANVIADNLNGRYPAVTSTAILAGLANGDSIGHTLHSLGLSSDEASTAKKNADEQIKAAKKKNKQ